MTQRPVVPGWLGITGLCLCLSLSACAILPTNAQTAAPTQDDFNQGTTTEAQAPDLFATDALFNDVATPTKFAPQLEFSIDKLAAGSEPAVTTSLYQTKGELEVKRTDTIVEHATFHFDKVQPGLVIGRGKMDIGTPPKLTLDVALTVTSVDPAGSVTLSVKASSVLASVYVADMRIKQVPGGLAITTIGNATRANDGDDIHTTEVSARVSQTIDAGYIRLPEVAGPMRTRTVIGSEADPKNQVAGQKVFRQTYTIGSTD